MFSPFVYLAGPGLRCELQDPLLWRANSWHVGSSSPTTDGTRVPRTEAYGVSATGPPGKSPSPLLMGLSIY